MILEEKYVHFLCELHWSEKDLDEKLVSAFFPTNSSLTMGSPSLGPPFAISVADLFVMKLGKGIGS
jgi:hypothetical protein